jgi:hypothetical protein
MTEYAWKHQQEENPPGKSGHPSPTAPSGNSVGRAQPEPTPSDASEAHVDSNAAALKKLTELSQRVNQGDADAARQVFELYDRWPELWQQLGDLSAVAERALGAAVYGSNHALAESLNRYRDNLKAQLLGDNANLLVKMAAQRVIAAFMFSQLVDLKFADMAGQGGRINEWGRMKVQAERRFQIALKSLELVRKSDILAGTLRPVAGIQKDLETRAKLPAVVQNNGHKQPPGKKAVVSHRKPAARCNEEVSCNSSAEPFRPGEPTGVKAADRLSPYLQPPSANGHHSNGSAPQLAGSAT